jgi:hypothetical protein
MAPRRAFVAGKLRRGILLGYGCLRGRLFRRAGRNVEFEMLAYALACSRDGGNCGFRIGEQLRRRCSRRQVSDGIVADAERGEDAEPAHQHHDRGQHRRDQQPQTRKHSTSLDASRDPANTRHIEQQVIAEAWACPGKGLSRT